MLYEKILKKFRKKGICPFCKIDKRFVVEKNRHAILTPARAPYLKNHLLVFPKRHVTKLNRLKGVEKRSLFDLLIQGIKILQKKYPAVEVQYKEGEMISAHKSIRHVHFHLIPKRHKTHENRDKRTFLTEEELISLVKEIKKFN